jgi:hypothetical protein
MDFLTIVVAFAIGAVVFGLMLLLASLVERTAPEAAVGPVSGSARHMIYEARFVLQSPTRTEIKSRTQSPVSGSRHALRPVRVRDNHIAHRLSGPDFRRAIGTRPRTRKMFTQPVLLSAGAANFRGYVAHERLNDARHPGAPSHRCPKDRALLSGADLMQSVGYWTITRPLRGVGTVVKGADSHLFSW